MRARWQIRTTGFEPVQLSVKACVPATKLKEGGLKRKCQTTVLFVLPAAQLHYNRFLLTTSLPLLRF